MSSRGQENIGQFSSQYHTARAQCAIAAVLLLAKAIFGWTVPFKTTWLELDKIRPEELSLVVAVVLLYALVRMFVEWAQTDPARRAFRSSQLEFFGTVLLGVAGILATVTPMVPKATVRTLLEVPRIPAAITIVYGMILGLALSTAIWSLSLVRSRADAAKLGLPRLPTVTRAMLRALALTAGLGIIVLAYAFYSAGRFSYLWSWLVFGPSVILTSGTIWEVWISWAKDDSGQLRRQVAKQKMRAATDQHDTLYIIGGHAPIARHNGSPLARAAHAGDAAEVRRLLDSGADPDGAGHLGWTPLAMAVAEGHKEVVEALIDAGADVNVKNLAGRTPLMFACRYGFIDIARKLLDSGADPEASPSLPEANALMAAAQGGHEDVVRLLLERGAKAKVLDGNGNTAIDYAQAAGHGKVAAILRTHSK